MSRPGLAAAFPSGLGVLAAALLAAAAALAAQPRGGHPPTTVPVRITGRLVISFHGDPAAGCATRGLCDYGGTVVLDPGSQARLTIATVTGPGPRSEQVGLALSSAQTASEVTRSGPSGQSGRCADQQAPAGPLALAVSGASVNVSLAQAAGSLLVTRCAGPVDADLSGVAPSAVVPIAQLHRGRETIDLAGSRSFSAGGLSGSLTSDVRLVLGKPLRGAGLSGAGRRSRHRRLRIVTQQLSQAKLVFGLRTSFRGTPDPSLCPLLDSCGITGTLGGAPSGRFLSGQLVAFGSARLGYRRFLAALHGRRVPGITVVGAVSWPAGGAASEWLRGPGASCSDTATLPGGGLTLRASGRYLLAGYFAQAPLRTRCPGPALGQGVTLARGRVPRKLLRGRSLALTLHGVGALADEGYDVSPQGTLRLVLGRGRVSRQVIRIPAG